MRYSEDVYFKMLERAFKEIQHLNGEGEEVQAFAYIFHNVPSALAIAPDDDWDEYVYDDIEGRAKAYGLWEKVERWFDEARSEES